MLRSIHVDLSVFFRDLGVEGTVASDERLKGRLFQLSGVHALGGVDAYNSLTIIPDTITYISCRTPSPLSTISQPYLTEPLCSLHLPFLLYFLLDTSTQSFWPQL